MATYGFQLAPKGLKPVSRSGSALISPSFVRQYIDPVNTLSLGNGEVVQLGGASVAAYYDGLPGYVNARIADTLANPTAAQSLNAYGVVAAVRYYIPTFPGYIGSLYWVQGTTIASGTKVQVDIINDPDIYYEIQTNSPIGLVAEDIGRYCNLENINFIDGSANGANGITQGQSTTVLNIGTAAAGNTPSPNTHEAATSAAGGTFDVKIVGLSQRPRNYFGIYNVTPQPYNYAIVRFNNRTNQD